MQVQLIRAWQFRRVGAVLDLPDGVAEYLILRKDAVRYTPPKAECLVPDTPERPRRPKKMEAL